MQDLYHPQHLWELEGVWGDFGVSVPRAPGFYKVLYGFYNTMGSMLSISFVSGLLSPALK